MEVEVVDNDDDEESVVAEVVLATELKAEVVEKEDEE